MDVVTFIRDYVRMCNSFKSCGDGCPLYCCRCMECRGFDNMEMDDIHKIIAAVNDWSKVHPVKTRLMDFLEKYPKAQINEDGVPFACAKTLGYVCDCPPGFCSNCWNAPFDEAKENG